MKADETGSLPACHEYLGISYITRAKASNPM